MPDKTDGIDQCLTAVRERIRAAETRFGRAPGSVTLLAVSKRHPAAAIRAAHAAGQTAFGENYLQEAAAKQDELADLELCWHFIGAIQSNKTREAAARFHWVHTVDRPKIARRLGAQRPESLPPLQVCIQVNVDGAPGKAGCRPEDVAAVAAAVEEQPRLQLRGLMTLPDSADDFETQRRPFARLREIFETLVSAGHSLDTLSMGMTGDLEAAVAEGATLVRIGTALFGPRNP